MYSEKHNFTIKLAAGLPRDGILEKAPAEMLTACFMNECTNGAAGR